MPVAILRRVSASIILLALILLIFLTLPRSAPPPIRSYPSLSYGIHAFLWWDEPSRDAALEFVRQMRFQYVKQIFAWKDIQPVSPAEWDWTVADEVVAEAEYRGVKLIARLGKAPDWARRSPGESTQPPLDTAAFGAYCGELAARYKGRIGGFQVWNEPNLTREWDNHPPNATAYVRLLAVCYTAIKAADPDAVVISAGLAPTGTGLPAAIPDDEYLKQLYAAGMARYYDVLGLHAPGYKSPPETPPDDPSLTGQRWQAFRHLEDMRAIMVAHGEGDKQVALLELGWTTDQRETIRNERGETVPNPYRWHAVSEAQQAEYLVGAFRYAGQHYRPWMGLMVAIFISDPYWTEDNEEYWWSVVRPGPRVTQAFVDLANMERYIGQTLIPTQDPGKNPYTPLPPRPRR